MSYPQTDEAGVPILPRGAYIWDGSQFVKAVSAPITGNLSSQEGLVVAAQIYGKSQDNVHYPIFLKQFDTDGISVGSALNCLMVAGGKYGYNESTLDRWRNNTEVELLASVARTATTTSPTQTNYNHRGVIVFVRVTDDPASASLTIDIEGKDTAGNSWKKLLSFSPIDAVGTTVFIVYPGGDATAAEDITEIQPFPLPRTWRVKITHADSDSITYSVGASLIL